MGGKLHPRLRIGTPILRAMRMTVALWHPIMEATSSAVMRGSSSAIFALPSAGTGLFGEKFIL